MAQKILKGKKLKITEPDSARQYYSNSLANIPLLSAEEEVELSRRIAQGDEAALQKLINSNLRLVSRFAAKYARNDEEYLDMVQDGNIGLITAAKKFDGERGVRFSTHATWWIRQAIIKEIKDSKRNIRIPINYQNKIKRIYAVENELTLRFGRFPTEQEVVGATGITPKELSEIKNYANDTVSLNSAAYPVSRSNKSREDEIVEQIDICADTKYRLPDDEVIHNYVVEDIDRRVKTAIKDASERDQDIVMEYLGLSGGGEKSCSEIGKNIGVSRERIRQIKEREFSKIKEKFEGYKEEVGIEA